MESIANKSGILYCLMKRIKRLILNFQTGTTNYQPSTFI
jgi:hypothetical protein